MLSCAISIKKYTEAMKIVKVCNDKLTSATDAVNKILRNHLRNQFTK